MTKPSPRGSVFDLIEGIGFDDNDGLKLLVYGKSGTGKTTFWSTFPRNILAIICSALKKPGELRSIDTPTNRKRIKKLDLKFSDQLSELVEGLKNGKDQFDSVVLDHTTGFQDLVFKEVVGLDDIPTGKDWGMATQQQYGQVVTQCREHLRSLLSLDCNVVLLAQERTFDADRDDSLIDPSVGPNLMPSLAGWLVPACDYVMQTVIKGKTKTVTRTVGAGRAAKKITREERVGNQVEFSMRVHPHEVYITKFRMPVSRSVRLPEFVPDPTYDKIVALIRGGEE